MQKKEQKVTTEKETEETSSETVKDMEGTTTEDKQTGNISTDNETEKGVWKKDSFWQLPLFQKTRKITRLKLKWTLLYNVKMIHLCREFKRLIWRCSYQWNALSQVWFGIWEEGARWAVLVYFVLFSLFFDWFS